MDPGYGRRMATATKRCRRGVPGVGRPDSSRRLARLTHSPASVSELAAPFEHGAALVRAAPAGVGVERCGALHEDRSRAHLPTRTEAAAGRGALAGRAARPLGAPHGPVRTYANSMEDER